MATENRSSHSLFRARSRHRRASAFLGVLEERRLLAADYWTSAASESCNARPSSRLPFLCPRRATDTPRDRSPRIFRKCWT
jgi:hypothetical protein